MPHLLLFLRDQPALEANPFCAPPLPASEAGTPDNAANRNVAVSPGLWRRLPSLFGLDDLSPAAYACTRDAPDGGTTPPQPGTAALSLQHLVALVPDSAPVEAFMHGAAPPPVSSSSSSSGTSSGTTSAFPHGEALDMERRATAMDVLTIRYASRVGAGADTSDVATSSHHHPSSTTTTTTTPHAGSGGDVDAVTGAAATPAGSVNWDGLSAGSATHHVRGGLDGAFAGGGTAGMEEGGGGHMVVEEAAARRPGRAKGGKNRPKPVPVSKLREQHAAGIRELVDRMGLRLGKESLQSLGRLRNAFVPVQVYRDHLAPSEPVPAAVTYVVCALSAPHHHHHTHPYPSPCLWPHDVVHTRVLCCFDYFFFCVAFLSLLLLLLLLLLAEPTSWRRRHV